MAGSKTQDLRLQRTAVPLRTQPSASITINLFPLVHDRDQASDLEKKIIQLNQRSARQVLIVSEFETTRVSDIGRLGLEPDYKDNVLAEIAAASRCEQRGIAKVVYGDSDRYISLQSLFSILECDSSPAKNSRLDATDAEFMAKVSRIFGYAQEYVSNQRDQLFLDTALKQAAMGGFDEVLIAAGFGHTERIAKSPQPDGITFRFGDYEGSDAIRRELEAEGIVRREVEADTTEKEIATRAVERIHSKEAGLIDAAMADDEKFELLQRRAISITMLELLSYIKREYTANMI